MTMGRERILAGLGRVGVPGFSALAILAGCAWAEWVAGPQARAETAELHARVLAVRDRKENARPADSAQQALAATYARLPDDGSSNAALAALIESARAQGLATDAVQFETERSHLPGVVRHRVRVPVRGSYPALRVWISTALAERRGISLDAVQIKRKGVLADELEAQTTWSLWTDASSRRPVTHDN